MSKDRRKKQRSEEESLQCVTDAYRALEHLVTLRKELCYQLETWDILDVKIAEEIYKFKNHPNNKSLELIKKEMDEINKCE